MCGKKQHLVKLICSYGMKFIITVAHLEEWAYILGARKTFSPASVFTAQLCEIKRLCFERCKNKLYITGLAVWRASARASTLQGELSTARPGADWPTGKLPGNWRGTWPNVLRRNSSHSPRKCLNFWVSKIAFPAFWGFWWLATFIRQNIIH